MNGTRTSLLRHRFRRKSKEALYHILYVIILMGVIQGTYECMSASTGLAIRKQIYFLYDV